VKETVKAQDPRPGHRRELLAATGLLALGVLPRILLAATLPTLAFSDFRALIEFGRLMGEKGWAVESWHWIQFNPGLAMVLSVLFRVVPQDHETVARLATAAATGVLPLLPFFLWRPILSLRWRFLAGLLLALWPGQIFFSGVVAQENWALLPSVALGALAVRVVRSAGSGASPIAAGLLLAAAVALRQEMLIVLAPAALAAAGLLRRDRGFWRRAARLAAAAGLSLAALAWQRQAASGRFALTTEHGGLALLGSVAPGAADAGWVDPRAYIAAVEPDLLEDRTVARRAASRLAIEEWKRRPAFHAARSLSVSMRLAVESDADNLFWSVGSADALPEALRPRGQGLYARLFPLLRLELALVQGLFFASVLLAIPIRGRDPAILVLAACVLLKFALQSVASPLGRLMVPATALELLAVALGLAALAGSTSRGRFTLLAIVVVVAGTLLVVEPRWGAFVVSRDEAPRPVARFPLEITGGGGHAQCVVEDGVVTSIEWRRAWLRPGNDRAPARVVCQSPEGAMRLEAIRGIVRESVREGGALEITLEGEAPSAFSLALR
jgi:hypothetical protein